MKLEKQNVMHALTALAFLCTSSAAIAQESILPAHESPACAMTGYNSVTHAQETVRGTLTTSTGNPRPLSYGVATFSLNAARTAFSFTATIYNIDVTGTQTPDAFDNLVAAHIHVGALPGSNAPVRWGFFGMPFNDNNPTNTTLTPFASGVGGTFSGTWDLPEGHQGTNLTSNLPDMIMGKAYLNFHTVQFGPGEIRGQIRLVNAGACGDGTQWYRDFDADGFGDPARIVTSVSQPDGYVSNSQDCNDYRVYYQDLDNDGWGSSVKMPCGLITRTGDCDDNNNRVHTPQTFYRDADGDSWGNPAMTTVVCSSVPPAGYVKNRMDCNDNDRMIRYCPPTGVTSANGIALEAIQQGPSRLQLTALPNPVRNATRIQYSLPEEARVNIRIYDVMGREVAVVFGGRKNAGTHTAEYNTASLSSGVYYLRLVATANGKEVVETQKLLKSE